MCATVNLYDRGYGSLKILDSDAVNINSVLELSVPYIEQIALGLANPASERATNLVAISIKAVLREKCRSNV